jgi:O-antigen biosynthesis protein WbqP
MKRFFDISLSIAILFIFFPIFIAIFIAIRFSCQGSVLYWSSRVGKDNLIFEMPKFRTMKTNTPVIATHLLSDADRWTTPIGSLLRRSSLDELPQVWSILIGDMSFVGPRPALFNQENLIALRTKCGVHQLKPGLTGWAQVNGRDELTIPQKVQYEIEYLERHSFWFDIQILSLTFLRVLRRSGVSH